MFDRYGAIINKCGKINLEMKAPFFLLVYKKQERKYFIVPEHGNSTTKCIYTALEGDMIPRHLLKHATLKSVRLGLI